MPANGDHDCSHGAKELLERLSALSLEKLELEKELASYRQANHAYALELTEAFEEIVLLRRIGEYLELSDLSRGSHNLAEKVLPLLGHRIRAASLLLVGAERAGPESSSLRPSTGEPLVSIGVRLSDGEAWRGLIEHYRAQAEEQPVVRNHLADSAEGCRFPGIGQFILAAVAAGGRVMGWILAVNRQPPHRIARLNRSGVGNEEYGTIEAGLVSTTASILAAHARNVELLQEKEEVYFGAVRSLVSAIDAKDPYTCGHSERVALFARRLGQELRLDEDTCRRLYLSGLLHDVGKIAIRGETLRKPGRLTEEEILEIKRHPQSAWDILFELDKSQHFLPGVVHHHEHYDGRGYPDGLAGDEIPWAARILAVADTYDALTSDRPYRAGMSQDKAEAILREGAGSQWDPQVIDAALSAMPDLIRIRQEFQPRQAPPRVPILPRRSEPGAPAALAATGPITGGFPDAIRYESPVAEPRGISLLEIVVVLVVLGILAAVVAPRFLRVSLSADEGALRQTLAVVRDAIDRHATELSGNLPGDGGTEADFKADLVSYLRKFPPNPLKKSSQVDVQTSGNPLGPTGGAAGWRYDNRTGEFIANSNGTSSDGVTRYWEW